MSNQFCATVGHYSSTALGNQHRKPSIGSPSAWPTGPRPGDNTPASLKRQLSKSAENNPRVQCRLRQSRPSRITEHDVLDFWFDRNRGKGLDEEDYISVARVIGWEKNQICDWLKAKKREHALSFYQVIA
jgi:hypothetical protein